MCIDLLTVLTANSMLRANHGGQHFWDFPEQGYTGAPDIPNPLLRLQGVLFNSTLGVWMDCELCQLYVGCLMHW